MGAEESKLSHSKHERAKKDKYAKEDHYRYAANSYKNQYADSWEKLPKSSDYNSGSLKRSPRDKREYDYYGTNRSNRYYEKENRDRHRRHYSDDRPSSDKRREDKSSHRDRVRSDDRDSNAKQKEKLDRRKKESPRSVSEKKTQHKSRKDNKKRKSSSVSTSQSPERKTKSEKREKASTSCLPNVTQGKRRKKKADLEKHKRAHRSAPDLSNDDMSRVGAWLNSNTFSLSPESPAWHPAFSYSYGTLPGTFPLPPPLDGAGKPRQIVDGMGSPLGTIYPNGTFVPNASTASLGRQDSVEPPMNFRYSMPPIFQYPYLPYYFPSHPPYGRQHSAVMPDASSNERETLRNRSRSHNHIDAIGNFEKIEPIYATVSKVKKKNVSNPSSSTLPRERSRMQKSLNSCPSFVPQSGEYYSDIQETKDSMLSYRANRQISIDDVRHAEFGPIKTPPLSETETDFSEQDSSLSDSSTNDVELDSNEANVLSETTKSSSLSDQAKLSNLHFFQPISMHEVFIDDVPATTKKQRNTLKSNDSRNSPVVRLGEQESIVATSFLIEGEKAFCLTKTKKATLDVSSTIKSENLSKPTKTSVITIKPKIQRQNAEKQSSGTWFGLTGSSTPTKSESKQTFAFGSKSAATSQLSSSSTSSMSSRDLSRKSGNSAATKTKNHFSENKFATVPSKPYKSPVSLSPRSSVPTTQNLSPLQKSPTPKPRTSRITPTPDVLNFSDHAKLKESRNVSVQTLGATSKTELSKTDYFSDSSEGEPLMRDEDQDITRKLIRIDSRDSFTMKRRLKYHRRSSSLTDKLVSRSESLEKTSTLPLTPRSDSHVDDIKASYNSSYYVSSKPDTAFSSSAEPYVDALLHRAKSEELLKREMNRSSEELLSDVSPPRKKETLQERAARILGLNAGDLYRAKEKQESDRALLFPDLVASENQPQLRASGITSVTPSVSAQGNISHPNVDSSSTSHRSNEEEPGSFAVSVTESMLKRVPDQIEIKNVESSSYSSVDVSSISSDTSTPIENSDYSPVPDAEFLIEVSDSVLEDATVPCSVKPHKEIHATPAKEYKLPDDILLDSEASTSTTSSFLFPTTAHASLVASYADNIYERVPAPGEISHTSELSDDTTETESLDHSGKFLELVKQKAKDTNSAPATLERTHGNTSMNVLPDFGSKPKLVDKHPDSPVPVATHSAPLTPGEMDIVKQLYNNADDNTSFSSYDSSAPAKATGPRTKVDLQKEKVAKSIGFSVANLSSRPKSQQDAMNAKLEKVEDFEIKVFPGASALCVPATKEGKKDKGSESSDSVVTTDTETTETQSSAANSSPSDIEEVMQSLGLNPDEAWLVSL